MVEKLGVNASGPIYDWFPQVNSSNAVQNMSQYLAEPITLFISPYKAPSNPGLSVYWTLPIEFIFSYVVFILALAVSGIKNNRWVFFSIIILFDWLNALNSWLSPFAVGLWIAFVAQTGYYDRISQGIQGYIIRFLLFALGLTGVLFQAMNASKTQEFFNSFTFNAQGVITSHPNAEYFQMMPLNLLVGTCLMLLLETSSWMRFLFGNPIMHFFGKISFGVYLLHPTLLVSFGSWLVATYFDPAKGLSQDTSIAIVFLSFYAILIPFAWAFYHIADNRNSTCTLRS
jgi:peptidoglycan/LPS O-acetylase OafA/YrhL